MTYTVPVNLSESEPSIDGHAPVHADYFTQLNELMAQMLSYQSLDPLLQRIAEIVVEQADANATLILLTDEVEEHLVVVASAGPDAGSHIGVTRECGAGFAGLCWSTKQVQYLADSDSLEITRGFWPSAHQLLAVPLMMREEVIGVAVLSADPCVDSFLESSGLLKHLAGLAAIAIASAREGQRQALEITRMRALREIAGFTQNFDDQRDLIPLVTKTLMNAMDISRACFFYVDSGVEKTDVWVKEDGEIVALETQVGGNMLYEEINGWCYRHNEPAYLPRYHNDKRETSEVRRLRVVYNVGATFSVPVTSNNNVVGVVSISRELSARELNENERHMFFSICGQLSTAIYNKALLDDVRFRANHDCLTQLPNRYNFEKQLESTLEAGDDTALGAVLFLDLDGFKAVNDSLGHHVGDELLALVAGRFNACIGDNDLIARMGGDEFSVILHDLKNRESALDVASLLVEAVSEKILVNGADVQIGVSIGLSYFPVDGTDAETLVRNADEAMYRSKANGRGATLCFDQSMADESRQRIKLEGEIKTALECDQFLLYFQPQVCATTQRVIGAEALARWNHPTDGLVTPNVFIPVAEDAGLMNAFGCWVLHAAVDHLIKWQDTTLCDTRLSVNVAASQFLLEDFGEKVLQLLSDRGLPPSALEIEVTESLMMTDTKLAVSTLEKLRAAGVRVAVDDFGTGYSSLSYLKDLPLDVLKIDRSFVWDLTRDNAENSVVKTIMILAQSLGLETVAEGVETDEQLGVVRQLGCTSIQGYYYAQPVPADELEQTIKRIESDNCAFEIRKSG